jgi:hypothetical protein
VNTVYGMFVWGHGCCVSEFRGFGYASIEGCEAPQVAAAVKLLNRTKWNGRMLIVEQASPNYLERLRAEDEDSESETTSADESEEEAPAEPVEVLWRIRKHRGDKLVRIKEAEIVAEGMLLKRRARRYRGARCVFEDKTGMLQDEHVSVNELWERLQQDDGEDAPSWMDQIGWGGDQHRPENDDAGDRDDSRPQEDSGDKRAKRPRLVADDEFDAGAEGRVEEDEDDEDSQGASEHSGDLDEERERGLGLLDAVLGFHETLLDPELAGEQPDRAPLSGPTSSSSRGPATAAEEEAEVMRQAASGRAFERERLRGSAAVLARLSRNAMNLDEAEATRGHVPGGVYRFDPLQQESQTLLRPVEKREPVKAEAAAPVKAPEQREVVVRRTWRQTFGMQPANKALDAEVPDARGVVNREEWRESARILESARGFTILGGGSQPSPFEAATGASTGASTLFGGGGGMNAAAPQSSPFEAATGASTGASTLFSGGGGGGGGMIAAAPQLSPFEVTEGMDSNAPLSNWDSHRRERDEEMEHRRHKPRHRRAHVEPAATLANPSELLSAAASSFWKQGNDSGVRLPRTGERRRVVQRMNKRASKKRGR